MADEGLMAWRQRRMQELAEKFGGRAELGRKLGYRDGAYVGQMIGGLRPITEKLIDKAEKIPGCKGWFQRGAVAQQTIFDVPTDAEREFLENLRIIPDEERDEYAKKIAERADQMRAYLAKHLEKAGLPAPKSAAQRAQRVSRMTVDAARKTKDVEHPSGSRDT